LRDVATDEVNGTRVYRPKDLSALRNRLIFQIESKFPSLFYWAKRTALKQIFRQKTA
jgi:hypothetical protein